MNALPRKPWAEVWKDVLAVVERLRETGIKTLCKGNLNDILEVKADHITVMSQKPLRGRPRPRLLKEEDFRYVWERLIKKGEIHTLREIPKVRGRRAVICAILSHLPYIEGYCEKRKLILKLNFKNEL